MSAMCLFVQPVVLPPRWSDDESIVLVTVLCRFIWSGYTCWASGRDLEHAVTGRMQ